MENALLLLEKLVKYVYSDTVFQLSGLFSYPNSKAIEVAQHCSDKRMYCKWNYQASIVKYSAH